MEKKTGGKKRLGVKMNTAEKVREKVAVMVFMKARFVSGHTDKSAGLGNGGHTVVEK